jgi:hypothetical protein
VGGWPPRIHVAVHQCIKGDMRAGAEICPGKGCCPCECMVRNPQEPQNKCADGIADNSCDSADNERTKNRVRIAVEYSSTLNDSNQRLDIHEHLRTRVNHETEMPTCGGLEDRTRPEMKWSKRHAPERLTSAIAGVKHVRAKGACVFDVRVDGVVRRHSTCGRWRNALYSRLINYKAATVLRTT